MEKKKLISVSFYTRANYYLTPILTTLVIFSQMSKIKKDNRSIMPYLVNVLISTIYIFHYNLVMKYFKNTSTQ